MWTRSVGQDRGDIKRGSRGAPSIPPSKRRHYSRLVFVCLLAESTDRNLLGTESQLGRTRAVLFSESDGTRQLTLSEYPFIVTGIPSLLCSEKSV